MASVSRTVALLLAVVIAIACLLGSGRLADLGLDVWAVPDLIYKIRVAEKRHEQLGEARARSEASIHRKEEVVAELIVGRLSLREASEGFRRANPESPALARFQFHHLFPDASEEELLCRHVIHWVQETLVDDPDQCPAVIARLQNELRDLRAKPRAENGAHR